MNERQPGIELYCPPLVEENPTNQTKTKMKVQTLFFFFFKSLAVYVVMFSRVIIYNIVISQKVAVYTTVAHHCFS